MRAVWGVLRRWATAASIVAMGAPGIGQAADAVAPVPQAGDYVVRDFRFQRGEILPELRLHYLTLGTPRRDAQGHITNAVLMLHGTTANAQALMVPSITGELFGPGQPLDLSRYFVVVPDGLGRGGSSKPSDGLRARFPAYGYNDVVEAQYRLVHEGLGIDHLRLVLGVSMGGMQAWMWAERYPDFMDAVMPIACQPMQISGRNMLLRRIMTESIRHDPAWQGGDYTEQPRYWLQVAPLWPAMLDSPVRLQQQAPTRQAAIALYDKLLEAARKYDANDFLYWIESSWDYDPQPALGRIRVPVMAVNFADDMLNVAELGETRRLVESVPQARFVLIPASDRTVGHLTQYQAAVWKPYLAQLMQATESPSR